MCCFVVFFQLPFFRLFLLACHYGGFRVSISLSLNIVSALFLLLILSVFYLLCFPYSYQIVISAI